MGFWIDLALQLVIVLVVTAAGTFAWMFLATRFAHLDKPFRSTTDSATIRPWPPLAWAMALFLGVVALAGGVSGFYLPHLVPLLFIAIAAGIGALAWMCLLQALPTSWVTWNEHSVEGPTTSFSMSRREMTWTSIEKVRRSSEGSFIENAQGQKIVWSDMHIGARFLWGYLVHKRPDLLPQLQAAA